MLLEVFELNPVVNVAALIVISCCLTLGKVFEQLFE
jgi:hypothetical protein